MIYDILTFDVGLSNPEKYAMVSMLAFMFILLAGVKHFKPFLKKHKRYFNLSLWVMVAIMAWVVLG